MKILDFFMGANTPVGFKACYDELKIPSSDRVSFLIKGGAGTGKSTLMKNVAKRFGESEPYIERIHCSSDPDSLDGVILPKRRMSIIDATPPHVVEPSYPGGFEIVVNLCEYFNHEILKDNLEETIKQQEANNLQHSKCRALLKSLVELDGAIYRMVESCTDFSKIKQFATRVCKREIPNKTDKNAVEHSRLISAVTNKGYLTYTNTLTELTENIIMIDDPYSVSSNHILSYVKADLLAKGYEIFCCYNPLSMDMLEHIIVPELNLSFVTQGRYTDYSDINPVSVVRYNRFTDIKKMLQNKGNIKFRKKVIDSLIEQMIYELEVAKDIHDLLEEQYTPGVDFNRVDKKAQELYDTIEKMQ